MCARISLWNIGYALSRLVGCAKRRFQFVETSSEFRTLGACKLGAVALGLNVFATQKLVQLKQVHRAQNDLGFRRAAKRVFDEDDLLPCRIFPMSDK